MTQEGPKLITLSNLLDGAVEERFQDALARVLENLDDPNTDTKPARRIVVVLKVTTDDERRGATVEVSCATKLAPLRPLGSFLLLGRHEGRPAAVEALPQEQLFPKPNAQPRVLASGGE